MAQQRLHTQMMPALEHLEHKLSIPAGKHLVGYTTHAVVAAVVHEEKAREVCRVAVQGTIWT